MKKLLGKIFVFAVTATALVSGCKCNGIDPDNLTYDKVLIMCSAGLNDLSSYLAQDIEDLQEGYVPSGKDNKALILVSHLPLPGQGFSGESHVQLIRIYSNKRIGVVMDTITTYPSSVNLGNADDLKKILTDIKTKFKSDHYGMIFSSHATGWLPAGYYSNSAHYEPSFAGGIRRAPVHKNLPAGAVPYVEPEELPGAPPVKSIGMSKHKYGGETIAYEINLVDFASAIPMHMDYIIFDACLTGGIEVAYQLKDVCRYIVFSPTEVLAEGLAYKQVGARLLEGDSDVIGVASDYFDHYAQQPDVTDKSATISVVDCSKLNLLATVCKSLFSSYRDRIAGVDPETVQRYYRKEYHWFYDLEDILIKSGISPSDKARLESALDDCIPYKAASDAFMEFYQGFKIEMYSGLSMYLPNDGSEYLNNFYKSLEWNKATELVD